MTKLTTKATKVMEAINKYPDRKAHEIAKQIGCTSAYVRIIRTKMAHVDEVDEVKARIEANRHEVPAHQQDLITEHEWDGRGERIWCRHGIDYLGEPCDVCSEEDRQALRDLKEEPMLPLDLNDAPTQEDLNEVLEAASILNPTTLDEVLNERGSRYGSFLKHAIITQRFKAVMTDTPNWIKLDDDMVEALEMVAHKMGRILNGDPTYADSWVDIAGYAQLVADRLQGKER
jgi:hypothetical protein